jgi:hypothetical protein
LNSDARLFIFAAKQPDQRIKVKATMGQQLNKVQKRKRRLAYNKRQKAAAKANNPMKA